MSKLLIVESPGKIKKIQEYLGPDYIVMASVGHIIDLDAKTMSIDMDTFEPQYHQYPCLCQLNYLSSNICHTRTACLYVVLTDF